MVEIIARALAASKVGRELGSDPDVVMNHYYPELSDAARAALLAIRDNVTPGMLEAVNVAAAEACNYPDDAVVIRPLEGFRVMIDQALAEGGE